MGVQVAAPEASWGGEGKRPGHHGPFKRNGVFMGGNVPRRGLGVGETLPLSGGFGKGWLAGWAVKVLTIDISRDVVAIHGGRGVRHLHVSCKT
jgi:hypothetical protein